MLVQVVGCLPPREGSHMDADDPSSDTEVNPIRAAVSLC